jgi:hypothetical protein
MATTSGFTATALDVASANSEYAAPRAATGVRWSQRLSPARYSIWAVAAELDDGATITWDCAHGDDGVYVQSGALDVDGHRCPADGAVVVESGAPTTARAVGATRVIHCGPVDDAPPGHGLYGAPVREAHGVHVVGDRGWYTSGDRERVAVRWFADSTCPTCRIAFFHVWRAEGGVRDRSHTHTQDELITVLGGSVLIAGTEYGPGTCLAIPAHHRYSLVSGPDGFAILNYRRDVSVQGYRATDPTELEGALARGGTEIADFR